MRLATQYATASNQRNDATMGQKFPGRLETMFTALQNVKLSHLADTSLYDFQGLKPNGTAIADGDTAFDEEIFEPPITELLPFPARIQDEENDEAAHH